MTLQSSGHATAPNGAANGHAAPPARFEVGDFAVDEPRPMKVVCIGAGYSGIIAGIRFTQKVPNVDLTIYDKSPAIGGTWWANRYPGLTCDIPSHSYQLTFEPNTQWSSFYAPGPEILAYMQRVVDKYKLMRYIRLRHELVQARWDDAAAKWRLRVRRTSEGGEVDEEFEDTADVLFLGTGGLSRWAWPDIKGLKEFKGRLVHSAQWDVGDGPWEEGVKDWGDKKVGVIGNGSSGIQIVAALQPRVASLTNFVRSKTWISTSFSADKLLELTGRTHESTDYSFPEAYREALKDPAYYKEFRRIVDDDVNAVAEATIRDSEMQKFVKVAFKAAMEQKLASKPELAGKIIPEWGVCCRRLTPGPGYLEALTTENTTLETTPIERITPTGVALASGAEVPLDVLVCATGFNNTYRFAFPDVVGRNGTHLSARWEERPEAYVSVAVDGFPNMFLSAGPGSGVNSGSFLLILERQVQYAVDATLKLQRERLKTIEVKRAAVDDWREYMDAYFPRMVFTDPCQSWYKNDKGIVTILWPGSCLHAVRTLAHPRWEDFAYERLDAEKRNRFFWLGDGQTYNEKTKKIGGRAWHLDDDQLDIPPVPED